MKQGDNARDEKAVDVPAQHRQLAKGAFKRAPLRLTGPEDRRTGEAFGHSAKGTDEHFQVRQQHQPSPNEQQRVDEERQERVAAH